MGFLESHVMVSYLLPTHSKALNPTIKEILHILPISFAYTQHTKTPDLVDFNKT